MQVHGTSPIAKRIGAQPHVLPPSSSRRRCLVAPMPCRRVADGDRTARWRRHRIVACDARLAIALDGDRRRAVSTVAARRALPGGIGARAVMAFDRDAAAAGDLRDRTRRAGVSRQADMRVDPPRGVSAAVEQPVDPLLLAPVDPRAADVLAWVELQLRSGASVRMPGPAMQPALDAGIAVPEIRYVALHLPTDGGLHRRVTH